MMMLMQQNNKFQMTNVKFRNLEIDLSLVINNLKFIFCFLLFTFYFLQPAFADTFTNKTTAESFTGFATTKETNDLTVVRTEKGTKMVDLSQYNIIRDANGRENEITIIGIEDGIQYKAQTDVFNEALEKAANRGPRLIIIEIDSPGGRLDLCRDICLKIEDTNNCDIIAYIKGGPNGGAYSAAAAVALACNKIYMNTATAIGAATPYMMTQAGIKESDEEVRKGFAGVFAYYAAKNNRPEMLAAAMVDNSFSVAEIEHEGKRYFVDPCENKDFPVKKLWSTKGGLISLSADDAADTGISDGTVGGLDELVVLLKVETAQIKYDKAPLRVKNEIETAKKKVERTLSWADSRIRRLNTQQMNYQEAIKTITNLRKDLVDSLGILEKYPDIESDKESIESLIKQCDEILKR